MSNVALTAEAKDANERANLAKFASSQGGSGPMLKFKKGEFFLGTNNMPVALGTQFIAHVPTIQNGWIKFEGGALIERKFGRVADGFVLPMRDELDCNDKAEWSEGPDGHPADPWSQQTVIGFESIDGRSFITFVTGSTGGKKAISELSGVYARDGERGKFPVIELAVSSFESKKFGKIVAPSFPVVDWRGGTGTTILPPEKKLTIDEMNKIDKDLDDDSIPF